ncbi:serine/threonine protein kinase [Virgisporangium aliadipatigenens]|uniref:non-specific serine/threonine protein kinase n=1 Tax=Virgisporangium aliadipatigenens TaxID=741659 RepID=A0A8J4DRX1_9ACTN|nr:Stk1 family PASTA domain-containing Ser/Thr kinase [Virgisporangium aliadipatigenens]GIJ47218.1 serine/threonine protein kinase [Virgisporangium aliadipatigenens]
MTAQARLLGGRYQVGELLGFGGMAEVHRGRDLRLGRDVAIKTLRHDLARDATFQMRFQREAQNSASLNHPAIVAVYDTGEEIGSSGEKLPYIVMEFVNGRTLKEVLGVEGRLQSRRALELTADVCSALDFSHRHGIIHRDIKPGNVMMTQTGQVKVMDFGIARALASGASTMTQTSAVIGTAQYLSPEQARGEAVDARSDVYATGCLIFELLTGQPPFVGDNPVSVAYQHVREEPRAPSELNPDVTPEIDSVVLKALAKNPANRYQSAGEMRADLLRAAAGRPVSAPPVMSEDQRTAMMAPQQRVAGPPTRPVARVADRRQQKNGATAIVVLITILGMLAFGALGLGLYLANQSSDVSVPDLTGKTAQEAEKLLADQKLRGKSGNAPDNCDQKTMKDKVVAQQPAKDTSVAEGTEISYQVCRGPGETTVPNLVGKNRAQAQKELDDRKLRAEFKEVSDKAPVGQVVSTSPGGGDAIKEGATVTVNLSKGDQKQMPSLKGKSRAQAEQELEGAGIDYRVVEQTTTNSSDFGRVISTDPGAGATVRSGQTVTVNVGKQQAAPSSAPPSSPSGSPSPNP